jgi:uncharacterized protein (DUF1499 family)
MLIGKRNLSVTLKWIRPLSSGLLLFFLSGCAISPLDESDPDPSLNWCPPLLNCVSTEAVSFLHSIDEFELIKPVNEAWPDILAAVSSLPRTEIKHQYEGYLYAKSYSSVFQFVDYLEVLYVAEEQRLSVRSSSMLGLLDFFVNYLRTESLRERLIERGVIRP